MDVDVVSGGNKEFVVMKRALIWVGKALFLAVAGLLAVVASFSGLVILLPFLPLAIAAHFMQTIHNRYVHF